MTTKKCLINLICLTNILFCNTDNKDDCISGLRSKDLKVKQACAQELGEKNVKKAVIPLIESLEDSTVAFISARSLGLIGDRRAITPLTKYIFYGKGAGSFNRMAIWALGELCAKSEINLLRSILNNQKYREKMNSADINMLVKTIKKLENCEI